MGFEVSKESIRKHFISEVFISLAPVEAYELTNEQKIKKSRMVQRTSRFWLE